MPAGIVLASGRSSGMGTPKAWLDWHGTTLLRRTCGVVGRGAGGPVVVVRAPGQELPELPEGRAPLPTPSAASSSWASTSWPRSTATRSRARRLGVQ